MGLLPLLFLECPHGLTSSIKQSQSRSCLFHVSDHLQHIFEFVLYTKWWNSPRKWFKWRHWVVAFFLLIGIAHDIALSRYSSQWCLHQVDFYCLKRSNNLVSLFLKLELYYDQELDLMSGHAPSVAYFSTIIVWTLEDVHHLFDERSVNLDGRGFTFSLSNCFHLAGWFFYSRENLVLSLKNTGTWFCLRGGCRVFPSLGFHDFFSRGKHVASYAILNCLIFFDHRLVCLGIYQQILDNKLNFSSLYVRGRLINTWPLNSTASQIFCFYTIF